MFSLQYATDASVQFEKTWQDLFFSFLQKAQHYKELVHVYAQTHSIERNFLVLRVL